VKRLVAEDQDAPHDADTEAQRPEHSDAYPQDGGSDDDESDDDGESFDALEERFHGLEEEVANLVADVHDLALYTKLNITGFMKILKVLILIFSRASIFLRTLVAPRNTMYALQATYDSLRIVTNYFPRNKQTSLSNQHLFKNTSRSDLSTNIIGTPSS
jgi:hypothetical protein